MERNRWNSHRLKTLPCSLRVEGSLNRKLHPVVHPEAASLVYACMWLVIELVCRVEFKY